VSVSAFALLAQEFEVQRGHVRRRVSPGATERVAFDQSHGRSAFPTFAIDPRPAAPFVPAVEGVARYHQISTAGTISGFHGSSRSYLMRIGTQRCFRRLDRIPMIS
jgi:hypothetical protein